MDKMTTNLSELAQQDPEGAERAAIVDLLANKQCTFTTTRHKSTVQEW